MEYSVDVNNKSVLITHKGTSKKFIFSIERAFHAFVWLVKNYPNAMPVNHLPKCNDDSFTYRDSNKAFGDLFQDEGYDSFVDKDRRDQYYFKINIDSLFDYYKLEDVVKEKGTKRKGPSKETKDLLDEKHNSKCNFMGQPLYDRNSAGKFMSKLFMKAYDHRIPLSKWKSLGLSHDQNDISNYQLISEYANSEKNKVCKACNEDCFGCALSFPEMFKVVKATSQSMEDLFRDEMGNKE